jgi:hypothetical protein
LTAIQFDDQFPARRAKVYDVVVNSVLISKMDIVHAMSAQSRPEFDLGGSGVMAQFFGTRKDFERGAFVNHTPSCLPHFEERKWGR